MPLTFNSALVNAPLYLQRLLGALAAARTGVWSWAIADDHLTWSKESHEIFGTREGSQPMTLSTFTTRLHPDDKASVERRMEESLRRQQPFQHTFRIVQDGGTVRWVLSHGRAEYDESGSPLLLSGTMRDVTEEKETEARERDSQERLNLAVEATGLGLWSWDIATGAVNWTPQCYQIHGLRENEFDGTAGGFFKLVHPDDQVRVQQTVEAAIASRELYENEFRILRPDGSVVWVSNRGRARYDSAGKPLSLLGTLSDITTRKASEIELRQAQERIRVALDVASDIVWTKDPEGRMRGIQLPWEKFTGQTFDAYQHHGWIDALHPEDQPQARDFWQRSVEHGNKFATKARVRRRDGVYRTFEGCVAPVLNEQGQILEWVGVQTDVTEMREAHRIIERQNLALRQADATKDIFLATLSHELRNPLAPIRMAADLLGNPSLPFDRVDWARGVLRRQVAQVSRLLDDLLDISRITQGKIVLQRTRVPLDEVVTNALEVITPAAEARGHRISIDMPRPAPVILGDAARLGQVLGNLLMNACKYTNAGGEIKLAVRSDDAWVEIAVHDYGIGLHAETIPTLFQMFRQDPAAKARSDGGLGVGLALVRGLVELHGGSVSATSPGLGMGSIFTVRFPQAYAVADMGDATSQAGSGMTPSRRVLIVDDNIDAGEMLGEVLRMSGHVVMVSGSGAEGIRLARESVPDVAFIDLGMPELDGFEVARILRLDPSTSRILLVALTGWGQPEDRERTRLAGFAHHLTKPVAHDVVETLVKHLTL